MLTTSKATTPSTATGTIHTTPTGTFGITKLKTATIFITETGPVTTPLTGYVTTPTLKTTGTPTPKPSTEYTSGIIKTTRFTTPTTQVKTTGVKSTFSFKKTETTSAYFTTNLTTKKIPVTTVVLTETTPVSYFTPSTMLTRPTVSFETSPTQTFTSSLKIETAP